MRATRATIRLVVLALLLPVWLAGCQSARSAAHDLAVTSPNGALRVELALAGGGSTPTYRVCLNNRELLAPSPLSVQLADGTILGTGTSLQEIDRRSVREEFDQVAGKRRHVVSVSNELRLALPPEHRCEIIVRVADDGVALRWRFLDAPGTQLLIADERTCFRIPAGATITALPLASFTTSHEGPYRRCAPNDLTPGALLDIPLLAEVPGAGCFAITEANLTDYAGMYLTRSPASGDTGTVEFVSRLAPRPSEPAIAVRARTPHQSPWRVILVADAPHQLLDSDLVLALNDPCALDDVAWIRPGKTTFPWWNGYVDPGVAFDVGLNTATMLHYIDFCARAAIPYHTLDGKNDLAWYGGPIQWAGSDPTRALDTIDMPAILRHAADRGVSLRVWMHWRAAQAHMDHAFPLYHAWGLRGVMLDFMDRNDQEMNAFLRRALQLAAANQLTVVLHGVAPPTGLERTFPNLLSSEGVWNLEYNKWDEKGCTPEHQMTVVFTRMLAGPMDFHQGGVHTVPVSDFHPRWEAPLVMGTPCRTLASYVVFQNHLAMVADSPSAYATYPLLDALASVPDTWDETRALAGAVGEYIVIARRSGRTWWLGAMTNSAGRTLDVPLSFLGPGKFAAEVFEDDPAEGHAARRRTVVVDRSETLHAELAPAGAWVARVSEVR